MVLILTKNLSSCLPKHIIKSNLFRQLPVDNLYVLHFYIALKLIFFYNIYIIDLQNTFSASAPEGIKGGNSNNVYRKM